MIKLERRDNNRELYIYYAEYVHKRDSILPNILQGFFSLVAIERVQVPRPVTVLGKLAGSNQSQLMLKR